MHLHRVTPDPFNAPSKYLGTSSENFRADTFQLDGEPAHKVVVADFPRFGGGDRRQSDFEVLIQWEDVERIFEKFCEAGHPEALATREAKKLAVAAKDLGWRQPKAAVPQSN